jgi:hypothetical protein
MDPFLKKDVSMQRKILVVTALSAFIVAGNAVSAQSAGNSGWLASGFYVGGRGQYRLPQSTDYTTGFDGQPLYATQSGDRFDTPDLGKGIGYGAGFGFTECEGPRSLAVMWNAAWSMAEGEGSSSIGSLGYLSHEVDLYVEGLYPLGSGFALSAQIGWNLDFFSISNGLLPYGGSRATLLLTSFVGFDIGAGAAYVLNRRLLIEAKALFRLIGYNIASGGGVSDSLATEIGRGETALEITAGWVF